MRMVKYVERSYKKAAEKRQSPEECCRKRGANVARGRRALMAM
jgi:hypothetical protein